MTVTELKNKLNQYLRLVKQGEIVEVLDHGVPIARLQGIEREQEGGDALLERLIREGIVTRAERTPTKAWLRNAPVPCKGDAVRASIERRGER